MLRLIGFVVRAIGKLPGADILLEKVMRRARAEAGALSPEIRARFLAAQFEFTGAPAVSGAAIGEAVHDGIVIAGGIAPNDRPYSMCLVGPGLPHHRRREVFEEIRAQLDKAIATTIDVPR